MPALVINLRRAVGWMTGVLASATLTPVLAASTCDSPAWPFWQDYATRYVQADGRMLESSLKANHSTSEGQSYGMLFALVANDRERFDRLWTWTAENMTGADPRTRLPGWLWGQGEDGSWKLQDANSASDADLWIIYALLEAARIWQHPAYRNDALALLNTVEARLVVNLPGLGKMLLPGPEGFVQPDHLWRLNASYLPVPLLRRLAREEPAGPWKEIADNTAKLIDASSPKGFIADWVGYRGTSPKTGLFVVDPVTGELGSYDAIRVYLWAGMTPASDPLAARLLARLDGMAVSTASSGTPPEKVQVMSGVSQGQAPFGYSAALLPYFQAKGPECVKTQGKPLL
ncbi:endo-1,4-D-glucanase [Pseudomonas syringae pv. actinidiae ICMP 19103]|uniref:cellulase n=4 Tax=Pseudomonas syringae TaxID=317 RepID=A0A2V0Q5F1_PSESF|nr:endo-1,4-D-glucanase [Pseudomonas syringae pv. actinidiae ICMP 9853]EPM54104.1 endo-1,4-D-glucanase [Pseudomonas syringae pv. actinidiae ICMP 19103]EPM88117.1 endo-1,4-D-glucanase [Pseudomonas syringae pv. actinidiae ICMP 19068]EPM96901.1 endo-1,4-D-glucanase [Pseudomonas syringae pv. actinidiae ICMP 19104]EPN04563.1 endo-1,4-D-glucanase [Pseudomonas syringae pv. actinidiae ICMP 19102]EPN10967.1 endo-1,4-D-glucanase [Pseudomonas syringae pv. actinidiae ICMP 9855]NVL39312.1 cellulase [Pseud